MGINKDSNVETRQYTRRLLKACRQNIHCYGFCVMAVGPGPNDPPFSYTVGVNDTFDHPDILIAGLESVISHQLMWDIVNYIKVCGPIECGKTYSEFVANYDVMFFEVRNPERYCTVLYRLYPSPTNPVYQMVFPDRAGHFPSDPRCDDLTRKTQIKFYGG